MEKYLVTGATGHIGNVLIRQLVKQNKSVKAIVRKTSDKEILKGLNIEIAYGDITDKKFIESQIEKDMIVFHLAGNIDISSKDPYEEIINTNIGGTKNIVDACIKNGAKKLIYTSSVHVLDPDVSEILKEPTDFSFEKKVTGAYATTKLAATKYVIETAKKNDFFAVVVYPAGVIGPYDYKISELGQIVLDYMNKSLPAYVKGGYNFVDVRDVAKGMILASEKGRKFEDYILSGDTVTLKEMFTILNQKLNRKHYPFKAPLWLAKAFSAISSSYYKAKNKKPVYSAYSLSVLNSNCNFTHEKASKELGYNPRSAKEGLEDSVDWFIKNKPEKVKMNKIKNMNKK